MLLSFFTSYAFDQYRQGRFKTEEDAFRFMHDSGIEYGDIIDLDIAEYPLYLQHEIMTAGGVKPACFISTLNVVGLDAKERARNIAITKERIDSAAKLGIPTLMVAPFGFTVGSSEEYKRVQYNLIESLSELVNYGKKAGVGISAENHSSLWRPDSRMKDVRYFIDAVPEVIYILDTGNFFCIGEDVKEAYKLLKDRTEKIHLKDWKFDPFGDFERENLPRFRGYELGAGKVPLLDMLKTLKADGFDREMVIEINSPCTWDEFDRSVEFVRGNF